MQVPGHGGLFNDGRFFEGPRIYSTGGIILVIRNGQDGPGEGLASAPFRIDLIDGLPLQRFPFADQALYHFTRDEQDKDQKSNDTQAEKDICF